MDAFDSPEPESIEPAVIPEPESIEPAVIPEPESIEPAATPEVGAAPTPGLLVPPPPAVHRPKVVSVEVTAVRPDHVEVRLADGRPGVIPRREFDVAPAVGESVAAAPLNRDDPQRVWMSHTWAVKALAWERLRAAHEAHTPIAGAVRKVVKGGLVVDVDGQRGFLPTSLIADQAPPAAASLVGQTIDVAVVELDETADRIVVSRRDVVRREKRRHEREVLASITKGQTVSGRVSAILEFGVQIDLGGGVRGLVHRSELTWGRLGEISELVTVGDTIEVLVLDVQKAKRRISLSLRQLTSDPYAGLEVGWIGQAEISRVVEYGAFARLLGDDGTPGAEGLVHMSELSELPGYRPDELVTPGEVVAIKIIDFDRKRRRIGLSVKQALLS